MKYFAYILIALTISSTQQEMFGQVIQEWLDVYDSGTWDFPRSITIDDFGNIYVTGTATIKYNSSGQRQWIRLFDYPRGIGEGEASAIVLDDSGNVYITGGAFSKDTLHYNVDFLTIKYNSDGELQWSQRYEGPANSLDVPLAIAIDDLGNVYVTGWSYGLKTFQDYATIKYNALGEVQWVQRYNGPANSFDYSYSIALDDSGNVYITGGSTINVNNADYTTIKYNSFGVQQWIQRYNGTGNADDNANVLVLDNAGNVYITGYSTGNGSNYDYATVKYNSSGVQQWVQRYNGPANYLDNAVSMKVDNGGYVYVTGQSYGIGTGVDYATIKYNSSGLQQWVNRYNCTGDSDDVAFSMSLDTSGNIYVTGGCIDNEHTQGFASVKYNSFGIEQWSQIYKGIWYNYQAATGIVTSLKGDVYVTGYAEDSLYNYNYTTIKYSQPIGIQPISTEIPNQFSLSQNYPNPFNPTTNIKFEIPKSSFVKLVVYDILGGEITRLAEQEMNAGSYSVDWDASNYPSGVYFYRLETDEFSEAKKMVLIK